MRRHRNDDHDDDSNADFVVEQKSSGVATFLVGLAIGAGLTMLLTPRSGADIRRSFRNAIARKRGRVQRAVREGKEAAAEAREDLQRRLAESKAAHRS